MSTVFQLTATAEGVVEQGTALDPIEEETAQ